MAYRHGIYVTEESTDVSSPATSETGIPVVIGTAPIHLVDDPYSVTNKVVVCNSYEEAVLKLGYDDDFDRFTLCQAMDSFFKMFQVGPVAFINVLDVTNDKAEISETLDVVNGVATTEYGTNLRVIIAELVVSADGVELTKDTDYTIEFSIDDDSNLEVMTITLLDTSITSITLQGNWFNVDYVTAETIIGSYDAETGLETGLEVIRQVFPTTGLVPNLLLAPGWSKENTVGLALCNKCTEINGVFTAECIVDINTEEATAYTAVESVKEEYGYTSEHCILTYPKVMYNGKQYDYSAVYAALCSYTDYNNDNVPSLYPSNKEIPITATVVEDGTELLLDQSQANELNAIGVVTAINISSWRAWGNNTGAYPDNTDTKDRWIGCRRFFSWWGNRFITTYIDKVDNPANTRLTEAIVDEENVYGNSLVSEGKCAGASIEFNEDENSTENLLAGKVVFHQYIASYTPAENIENTLEFDVSMLETALGGE